MFLISCRLLFVVSFSHVEYCSNVYDPEIYLFFFFPRHCSSHFCTHMILPIVEDTDMYEHYSLRQKRLIVS